jgi:ribonuclease-3
LSWLDFIPFTKKPDSFARRIKEITGIKPKNLNIYRRAFTHKSSGEKDANGYRINYERMEFLGDALLDAVITDYLYHHLPTDSEGELTKMRSKIVSRRHLNEIGKNMGLVRLSKKRKSRRKYSYNAHGDMFEALVAAIYLDRGLIVCRKYLDRELFYKW